MEGFDKLSLTIKLTLLNQFDCQAELVEALMRKPI
jgi:hypothetical protein